jgi:hypothetical protein
VRIADPEFSMAGNESGRNWEQTLLIDASHLSPGERAVRDKFVEEYLLDRDPTAACLRIGYDGPLAIQRGFEFLEESYVQKRIAYLDYHFEQEDPEAAQKRERRILKASLMREAHYRGPGSTHAARVAALSKLAQLARMDAPEDAPEDKELALINAFKAFAQKVPV